jgi:uncharacterized protein
LGHKAPRVLRAIVPSVAVVLFVLLVCAAGVRADDATGLAGAWTGVMVKDGDPLPVTMTFAPSGSAWTGIFGSDAQQAAGIPLSVVRAAGTAVHFELRGDEGTSVFDGTRANDTLSGAFTDGDTKGTFRLVRDEYAPPAPRTRDVSFSNGATTLSGTVVFPQAAGRRPAILFLQGSGPEGRWANRWLAERFARAGFVALIFDKRGVGGSGGDWRSASFETLAADGAAGVRFLRSLSEVDPRRVGVYGHSQGGSVAPLVDADAGGLAFIIASAAPGLSPADVETYSVENEIGVPSLPPAERADAKTYVKTIVDVAYRGRPRADLDAVAAKFKGRSWFFAPPPPESSYWSLSRAIAAFDPAAAWSRVKAPVFLVYGLHDERVPPERSLNAIRSALRSSGNDRVSVKLYADADHTFTIVEPPHATGWSKREPDYADVLTSWASSRS